jgi:hypothetical protein
VWKRVLLYIYVFNSFPLFWYMMGVEEGLTVYFSQALFHTHIPEKGERVKNINIQPSPLPHPSYTRKGGKS